MFKIFIIGIISFTFIGCTSIFNNYEDELSPIMKKISLKVEEKFVEKNKNNYFYQEYSDSDYMKYNYLNKEETFKIIKEVTGCIPDKADEYYKNIYNKACSTKKGLTYNIEVNGPDSFGEFDVDIDKDRTHCYLSLSYTNTLTEKEIEEGKRAHYISGCTVGPIITIRQ